MLCSICNRVPVEPVVAKTNGCLFERGLVEKYIDEHGRCPVTGAPLARADLITVRPATVAHASPAGSSSLAAVSLPGLLDRMRAEWDGVMLEQFTLRQQLAQQQQELAHALQQYEAACRVIAAMTRECDALRRGQGGAGQSTGPALPAGGAHTGTIPVPAGLNTSIDKAEAEQQAARKLRKGKEVGLETFASASAASVVVAAEAGGAVGLALVQQGEGGSLFTARQQDCQVVQFSLRDGRVVAAGAGHDGPVHSIAATSDGAHVISAAEDGTVRVWKPASHAATLLLCEHTLRYASGVSALSQRVIDDRFIFSGSRSGTVYISDITRGEHVMVSEVRDDEGEGSADEREDASAQASKRHRTAASPAATTHAVSAVALHPYTKLGAIGTEGGELFVWNVKEEAVDTAITLPSVASHRGHTTGGNGVESLEFSLDCVTLAAGLSNGGALVWDLRRIDEPLATFAPRRDASGPAMVAFDGVSGTTLAVGCGKDIRVAKIADLSDSGAMWLSMGDHAVSGLAWGSSYLAAMGIDGVVKVFGDY